MSLKILKYLGIVFIVLILAGLANRLLKVDTEVEKNTLKQYERPPEMMLKEDKNYQATITTDKGEIVIDLFEDKVPLTVNNFVFLSEDGYYDDVIFHRIVEGFMIQTGDPTGTGSGSPGYLFYDEEFKGAYTRGIVAMANAGPDTNGSQFFIMHQDVDLPANYVIFGEVVKGMETVDKIATVPVGTQANGEQSRPLEEVKILKVDIRTF